MSKYITIAEGATIYNESYRSFYDKVKKGHSLFYPKLHHTCDGTRLSLQECLALHQKKKVNSEKYISLSQASYILFGEEWRLARIYRTLKDNNCLQKFFLQPIKINGYLYFDKKEFNLFYKEKCKNSRLMKRCDLKEELGFVTLGKFYCFLAECNFNEVQGIKLVEGGYNFYPLANINAWLLSLGCKTIR